jgi:hypothetical protein
VPDPPSSQTPLLAVAHESSLAMTRVFARKPHWAHCVAYGQTVGSQECLPPSRHLVSPSATCAHVFWHSEKSGCGASGGAGGEGDSAGALGGGEGRSMAPVTVKARSAVRCSCA